MESGRARVEMKATLSTRLIVWVGVPATLLFALVLWFSAQRALKKVIAQTQTSAQATARYHAARLDRTLSAAAKIPALHGDVMESGAIQTREQLESYLRSVVESNRDIYGSCIVFRPYGFDETVNGYGPYFYHGAKGLEFVQLADADYNYFQWEWYRQPRDLGEALWTEPYFDDGGGNVLMTTRTVPFRREGLFWGVATIDIALDQLVAETGRIPLGKGGYAFIVSKKGRFVAFPDDAKVMKASIQDTDPELALLMVGGEDGFRSARDPLRGQPAWIAFAPAQNGGFSLALVYPRAEVLASAFDLQKELLAVGLVGLLGLFVALVLVARSISKPITQLAAAAQQVAQGDLEQRLSVESPTIEVANLTNAFNKMTRDLQMRMQELRYTTTVKERYEGELNAARSIQMSLVPKKFPPFPERPEFDVHALLRPAREIGGDFYDFYFLDPDRLCFLIGDVSGKGIPAALFMAVTKTLLKASSSGAPPIAQMMADVNDELCEQTDSGMFVSLLFAVLDVKTGALDFCNAGHPSPFLLSAKGVEPLDGTKNVALGALGGLAYEASSAQLAPGDALFLYTDGVTEALADGEHFYGPARLQITLKDVLALPVEKITRGVVSDVRAFCGDREQSDDISVVAMRWHGPIN